MHKKSIALSFFLLGAGISSGQIVISEIMFSATYNQENTRDYVEIVNLGTSSVNLSGWSLNDEDLNPTFIPNGTSIAAGEILIITNRAPAEFRTAWGLSNSVRVLDTNWDLDTNPADDDIGRGFVAFSMYKIPTVDNPERLGLFNASGDLVVQVNYFNGRNDNNGRPWPSVADRSLYMSNADVLATGAAIGANPYFSDDPQYWQVSTVNIDGAQQANNAAAGKTGFFWSPDEVGSPGYIQGYSPDVPIPEPASAALVVGLAALLGATRRRPRG